MVPRIIKGFNLLYVVAVSATVSYLSLHKHNSAWWLAWPVICGLLALVMYALTQAQPMAWRAIIKKLFVLIIGLPILLAAPLYPSTIRLAFVLLMGFFAVFAALIMKDEVILEYYALKDRFKKH